MNPSRRTTIQWMAAAAALPLARWSPSAAAATPGGIAPFATIAPWPSTVSPVPHTGGYGRDPNLMEPKVTWPLTFDAAQRKTIDLLGDMILPADKASPGAGSLGVGAFVDEWISAPYPVQQADRGKVMSGLAWLEGQCRILHEKPFAAIAPAQRGAILDALSVPAPVEAMVAPVAFMDTLRKLFVLGFYSLPEGKTDMGYIGDQPTEGLYPGPSKEALAHFAQVLDTLGLPKNAA